MITFKQLTQEEYQQAIAPLDNGEVLESGRAYLHPSMSHYEFGWRVAVAPPEEPQPHYNHLLNKAFPTALEAMQGLSAAFRHARVAAKDFEDFARCTAASNHTEKIPMFVSRKKHKEAVLQSRIECMEEWREACQQLVPNGMKMYNAEAAKASISDLKFESEDRRQKLVKAQVTLEQDQKREEMLLTGNRDLRITNTQLKAENDKLQVQLAASKLQTEEALGVVKAHKDWSRKAQAEIRRLNQIVDESKPFAIGDLVTYAVDQFVYTITEIGAHHSAHPCGVKIERHDRVWNGDRSRYDEEVTSNYVNRALLTRYYPAL